MIKRIILSSILFLAFYTLQSQVGIGTETPEASSVLDINSTSKGLLVPRMTQIQKNAILNPSLKKAIVFNACTCSFNAIEA